jgi:hypothetical protein
MKYTNKNPEDGPVGSWEAVNKDEAARLAGLRTWINAKFGKRGAPDSFSFMTWWNGWMKSLESE